MIRPIKALVGLLAVCLLVAACGPESPTDPGGEAVDPVQVLTILPSPGALRGEPATAADEGALQRAFTGAPDPELVRILEGRGLVSAGVRGWTGPNGQVLVAAISVWESHLLATGIGGQAAELLLKSPGGRAWTPSDLGGTRGARVDTAGAQQKRLSFAVGPNNVYVRADGPVDDATVTRAAKRLIDYIQATGG